MAKYRVYDKENRYKDLLHFLFPIACLLISMFCIQFSATLAKQLFSQIGATGTTALRLGLSTVILLIIFRPWKRKISPGSIKATILYGIALGTMNLAFYQAIKTIPLGIAVALEFTGPLAIAIFSSRKSIDFLWIMLAFLGLTILIPLGSFDRINSLDPQGVVYALIAGFGWGVYIIFGQKAGMLNGSQSVALGSVLATMIVFPIGLLHAGEKMFSFSVLPIAILVAIFASALPYTLEMCALTRLPKKTFSTLMSLEPAVAAFSGYLILHESLVWKQWLALLCIILASMGTAWSTKVDRGV